jgi:FkbM family methyltransferase
MASRMKLRAARLLSSRPVGVVVGMATAHRIPNHGLLFDTRSWDPRIEAMLAFRIYESAEIRFVRYFLKGTIRAVELGGSLGVTGSHLLQVMEPEGKLTSVEANARLIPLLRRSLLSHANGRTVALVHAAVAATPSPNLEVNPRDHTASRVASAGVVVPGMTLSAIVLQSGYEDYVLLSDIEGAEASFILGSDGLENCTRVVIELHNTRHAGRLVTPDDMLIELNRQGFQLLGRHGNVCALTHR